MSLLKIAHIGHPVLRASNSELTRDELTNDRVQTFIDDLIATMHDANGAGLAAPQVFEPLRICAIEVKDNPRYPYKPEIPLTVLVNPTLTYLTEERFESYEGCLSVPNLRGLLRRCPEVRVQAWDRCGGELDFVARGLSAGTYQHEVDHLDGMLFVDRVEDPKTLCTWEQFDRHHKAAFVERAEAVVARWGG